MLDLNKLREYYRQEKVIITIHAQERLRQRGIKAKDVRNCVMTGEIIEPVSYTHLDVYKRQL